MSIIYKIKCVTMRTFHVYYKKEKGKTQAGIPNLKCPVTS